jgi:hypothetical protein
MIAIANAIKIITAIISAPLVIFISVCYLLI